MSGATQLPSDPAISSDSITLPGKAATIESQTESSIFLPITFISRDYPKEIHIPLTAHTLDGFRQWALSEQCPDRGRFTFVDGELIIEMSPESIENHNFLKTEITSLLHARAKRLKLGRVYGDGCLFSNQQATLSTEPDATFATFETIQSGRCQVLRSSRPGVNQEIVGSPNWVLEVVSPWSKRKDKQLLRDGYFRAGIGEYWLIDALGDEIDFQLLLPGDGGYVAVEPHDGWLASGTFGCNFRLTCETGDDGLWNYTLHVQE